MFFFFFNDTATTEIYTLPLHDALPISLAVVPGKHSRHRVQRRGVISTIRGVRYRDSWHPREATQRQIGNARDWVGADRKSTRLNSSHSPIPYAVFCLKKKTAPAPPTMS